MNNVKNFMIVGLAVFTSALFGMQASGGLLIDALLYQNAVDDVLTDYSWGVARPDQIVVGLARLDTVNNQRTYPGSDVRESVAWMLFAVQVTGVGSDGELLHGPVPDTSPYNPKNLLNNLQGDFGDDAMLVLLELANPPAPGSKLYQLTNSVFYDWSILGVAIAELNNPTTHWLASFGIVNQQEDYFKLGPGDWRNDPSLGPIWKYDEEFVLSLIEDNPNDGVIFVPLHSAPGYFAISSAISVYEKSDAQKNHTGLYGDSGEVFVNAIPEPTSLVAMLSLGVVYSATRMLRRRRLVN